MIAVTLAVNAEKTLPSEREKLRHEHFTIDYGYFLAFAWPVVEKVT